MKAWPLLCVTLLMSGCQLIPYSPASHPEANGDSVSPQAEELAANITLTTGAPDWKMPLKTTWQEDVTLAPTPIGVDALPTIYQKSDLLDQLAMEASLPVVRNKRVESQLKWYTRHPQYLARTFERGRPFLHLIYQKVRERNMPVELVLLPIVESAFDPFAYSHGRASGIWQFVPGTARRYGLKMNWWYDGRRDVYLATDAALNYLEDLHRLFKGDWLLALAAYNSGEGNVLKAVRKNRRKGLPADFWHLDLPRETRDYVPKLLALAALVRDPHREQWKLPPIPNHPLLTRVPVGSQLDLALAADMAGIPLKDIYRYNPAFNRWATDPEGPHYLMVPSDKAATFRQAVASLDDRDRIKWVRYRVRTGDSVSTIARHFRTSQQLIMKINELRGPRIEVGQRLMIPVATQSLDHYELSADRRLAKLQARRHGARKVTLKVKPGDTLWTLSRRFHVDVRKLAKWNGMAPTDPLRAGRKLVVWLKQPSEAGILPPGPQKTRKIHYQVRQGDSLARISQKFRVGIQQLIEWNKLHGQKYLQPGQSLTLFVDVTRQSGI